MAEPKIYNFKPQYKGTWFGGAKLTITKTIDGVTTPLDITGYVFKMDFKLSENSQPTWSIETGAGITIFDAVNGVLIIDGFLNEYRANDYLQDLKMTPPNNKPKVYLKGIYPIKQNITN